MENGSIGVTGLGGSHAHWGRLPYHAFLRIQKALPNVTNATDIIEEMRLIKSEEEIKFIEKAVEISDLTIDAIVEKTRPGMKGYEIYALATYTMLNNFSEDPMFLFDHGPAPWHGVLVADARPIEVGDVICAVISPRYGGYFGHAHVGFFLGEPKDKEFLKLAEVALQSYENGLAALKPGITVQEASDAFAEPIIKAGYFWTNPLFHGLGLKMPDYPVASWNGMPKCRDGDMLIKEGMVLGLEGTVNNWEKAIGVSIGNAAVVTAAGARYLSKRKPEFRIIKPR